MTYRIMIVDDEEDIRTIVRQVLSRNFEVVEAYDGLDALQKLPIVEPDFIVLDVMMPLMDGFHVCQSIRKNEEFADVPVLFLSALNHREDIKKGYDSGATLYLTKPFDPMRLVRNIEIFLKEGGKPPRTKLHTIEEVEEKVQALPESDPELKEAMEMAVQGTAATAGGPRGITAASTPPASPAPEATESQEEVRETTSPGLKPRVMIVDDEEDIVTLVKTALGKGFEVVSASDGIQAIERIVTHEPDLVIIDAMMPRMSGFQLCQSLRRNRRFSQTPIVFLSGKSSPKDVAYAKRLGADEFITKPFEIEDLRRRLNKVAERRNLEVAPKRYSIRQIRALEEYAQQDQEKRERQRREGRTKEMEQFLRNEVEGA